MSLYDMLFGKSSTPSTATAPEPKPDLFNLLSQTRSTKMPMDAPKENFSGIGPLLTKDELDDPLMLNAAEEFMKNQQKKKKVKEYFGPAEADSGLDILSEGALKPDLKAMELDDFREISGAKKSPMALGAEALGEAFEYTIKRPIQSITAGALGTGELGMRFADMIGFDSMKKSADTIQEWRTAIMPENPNLADEIASAAGSSLTFFIPGLGVQKGATMLSRVSPKAAAWFGGLTSAFLESSVESGGVYDDVQKMGGTKEQARAAAWRTFGVNMVLVGVTNRFGLFGQQKTLAKRILSTMTTEGLQEFAQQVTSNVNTGRPWDEGAYKSGAIGALLGPILGSATGEYAQERSRKKLSEVRNGAGLTMRDQLITLNREGMISSNDLQKFGFGKQTEAERRLIHYTGPESTGENVEGDPKQQGLPQKDTDLGFLGIIRPEEEAAPLEAKKAELEKTIYDLEKTLAHQVEFDEVLSTSPTGENADFSANLNKETGQLSELGRRKPPGKYGIGKDRSTRLELRGDDIASELGYEDYEAMRSNQDSITRNKTSMKETKRLLANAKIELREMTKKPKGPLAPPKESLGDRLSAEERKKVRKQILPKQEISDAEDEQQLSNKERAHLTRSDTKTESDFEKSRKITQIEFNNTIAAAKQLPPEVGNKIIADLNKLKEEGKIATPLEARLQKNRILERRVKQVEAKSRALESKATKAKRVANNERMKFLFSTAHNMPAKVQKAMRDLHANYRTSMPVEVTSALVARMRDLNDLGAAQNRQRIAEREGEVAEALVSMEGSRKYQTDARHKKIYDLIKNIDIEHTPADIVIRSMGDAVHDQLKDPIDAGQHEALELQYKLDDQITRKAEELKLGDKELERINVYGFWNQEGLSGELGRARLVASGEVDPKVGPPKLTENEMKMYSFLRNMFDKQIFPLVKSVSENLEPHRLFEQRGSYWPNRFIGNNEEVRTQDMILGSANVAHGFTKDVTGNPDMILETGPNLIFDHIASVSKYIGMAEAVDRTNRILQEKELVQILGNQNVHWLANKWLTLVKSGGTKPGETETITEATNYFGKMAYDGILLGRATTSIKQFLSTLELSGKVLAGYGPAASADVLAETAQNIPGLLGESWAKEISEEVAKNPEMRSQIGIIDLVQEDLKSKRGHIKTPLDFVPGFKRFLNAFIRNPDMVGRISGVISVRKTLMKNYNMSEEVARRKANEIVRTVYGSSQAKDRPTVLGDKSMRPWYLFGVTELFRQGNYRRAVKDVGHAFADLKNGKITTEKFLKIFGGSSVIVGAFTFSSLLGDFLSTLNMDDDKDREEAQKKIFTRDNIFLTAVANLIPFAQSAKRAYQTKQGLSVIPFLGPFSGVLTYFGRARDAKKKSTRDRNYAKAATKIASGFGIPADSLRASWTFLQNVLTGDISLSSKKKAPNQPAREPGAFDLSGYLSN